MERLRQGQRVLVKMYSDSLEAKPLDPPAVGTVWRLTMSGDAAWVNLDELHPNRDCHPFVEHQGDPRQTAVLTFPGFCEEAP